MVTKSNNEIIACGGGVDKIGADFYKNCWKYDDNNGWRNMLGFNFGRKSGAMVAINDTHLLVSGGRTSNFRLTSTTEIYSKITSRWQMGPKMIFPRENHCVVNFNGQVLAIGGQIEGQTVPFVEKFDQTWSEYGHFIDDKRSLFNHACTVFQEKIFITGGILRISKLISSCKLIKNFVQCVPEILRFSVIFRACVVH